MLSSVRHTPVFLALQLGTRKNSHALHVGAPCQVQFTHRDPPDQPGRGSDQLHPWVQVLGVGVVRSLCERGTELARVSTAESPTSEPHGARQPLRWVASAPRTLPQGTCPGVADDRAQCGQRPVGPRGRVGGRTTSLVSWEQEGSLSQSGIQGQLSGREVAGQEGAVSVRGSAWPPRNTPPLELLSPLKVRLLHPLSRRGPGAPSVLYHLAGSATVSKVGVRSLL